MIDVEFDPMIAKVIAHAPTRREAAAKLARALQATRLQGLRHNRDFLVATLRTPAFLAGDTCTDFIERVQPAAQRQPSEAELANAAIACALWSRAQRRAAARVQSGIPGGFRNSVMPPEAVSYQANGHDKQALTLAYRSRRDGRFDITLAQRSAVAELLACDAASIDLLIDDQRWRHRITALGDRRLVHGPGGDLELLELPRHPLPDRAGLAGGLVAPMPGKVLSVAVTDGETVIAGQLLLVLEAMKMEHRITAPADGVVQSMKIAAGDQVANGALLVAFEPSSA